MGIDVILDSGFWTKASRKTAREHFAEKGIETAVYYFRIPDTIRLERLVKRNEMLTDSKSRQYIIVLELLETLDKKFEEPLRGEYDFLVSD